MKRTMMTLTMITMILTGSSAFAEDDYDKKHKVEKVVLNKAVYNAVKNRDLNWEKYKKATSKKTKGSKKSTK